MTARTESKTRPHVSERDFQSTVVAMARAFGWRVHHERPARTAHGWRTAIEGDAGFPDLILLRPPRAIAAELKSDRGRPTSQQRAWLDAFERAGIEAPIWRPGDLQAIEATLRRDRSAP